MEKGIRWKEYQQFMMQHLTYEELYAYVKSAVIIPFYDKRSKKLSELTFNSILKRKNPYLFKAKNITTAQDFVTEVLQAHMSSGEETDFGKYLEELAIFICSRVYRGFKSSSPGIDLELEKEGIRYIVTIKSGPNWGNSDQIAKMIQNFQRAKRVLKQNTSLTNIVAINGCCYGKDSKPDKGEYLKLCGQEFWAFISDDDALYEKIIEPLDEEAQKKDDMFKQAYAKKVNLFTSQFLSEYCVAGEIDWMKLLRFVSSKTTSSAKSARKKPVSSPELPFAE